MVKWVYLKATGERRVLQRAGLDGGMLPATFVASGCASFPLPLAGGRAGVEGWRAMEGLRTPGSPMSSDGSYESEA